MHFVDALDLYRITEQFNEVRMVEIDQSQQTELIFSKLESGTIGAKMEVKSGSRNPKTLSE